MKPNLPNLPNDYHRPVVVLLDGERIAVQYMEGRVTSIADVADQLRYQADYCYGDILAEATLHCHCTGFSHWYSLPGDSTGYRSPVFRWQETYTIGRRFRVGRKGNLKPV